MTSTPELVKHRFSEELRRCCGSHYQSVPSNEQFARDLHLSSKYVLKVSRETVRKWFKGDSFPDLDHLLFLIKWLGLDMTKIFVDALQLEKNKNASSQLPYFDFGVVEQITQEQITQEQINLFVDFLNSIKSSNLVKHR